MALGTLIELVKSRLPFLVDEAATDIMITKKAEEIYYEMASQTGKSEEEATVEENYTLVQRLFFADYVAYMLFQLRILQQSAGIAGVAAEPAAFLKRAKADVVETEFEQIKGQQYSASDLKDMLKISVCSKAQQLGYDVPICNEGVTAAYYPGKFRFLPGRPC